MNDIQKNKVKRFLRHFGIRLLQVASCKFPYDRDNFTELASEQDLVIFDVGANIGQSSTWFVRAFPNAKIHAFEPFPVIFDQLVKNTLHYHSIHSYPLALGRQQKCFKVPRIQDRFCQTGQVIERTLDETQPTDTIMVKTLDEFCSEHQIDQIHILKTDTEGHDLDVLAGAEKLLAEGKITNVLSEVSILPEDEDKQHTNLFQLKQFLARYDFELFSLYDLHHNRKTGRLEFLNALFKRKTLPTVSL